jgi:hypothetical protein
MFATSLMNIAIAAVAARVIADTAKTGQVRVVG